MLRTILENQLKMTKSTMSGPDIQSVSNRIYEELSHYRINQIAEHTGLSKQSVSAFLKGQKGISAVNLARVAQAYPDLDLDYVLRGQKATIHRVAEHTPVYNRDQKRLEQIIDDLKTIVERQNAIIAKMEL